MRRWVLLLLLLLFAIATPAQAQKKVYDISNYDVDLVMRTDGSYRVTEQITFDFRQGNFTFATRNIPLDKIDRITEMQVQSDDVVLQEVKVEMRDEEQFIRWTFPERTGPTTFTLSYTVYGALFATDGTNKIDWDAIGTGWSVPIYDVDVRVTVPAAFGLAASDIRIAPQGEGRLIQTPQGYVASFSHPRLSPGTAYRIIVSFPRQLEGRTSSRTTSTGGPRTPNVQQVLAAIIAGLLGLIPGLIGFFRWRGPKFRVTTMEKPDVSLPRAAVLLKGASTAGERAFPAVVFDLAARGHLTLRRVKRKVWIFSQKKVEVDFHEDPGDLNEFERELIDEMRDYETLEDFGTRARSFRSNMLKQVQANLIDEGYLDNHRSRSIWLFVTGFAMDMLATLVVLAGVFIQGWLLVAAGLLFGLGIGAFVAGTRMYTPTEKGARMRAEIEAYLESTRQEIERLRQYDPAEAARAFIRELPWLSLDSDVNRRWVKKLADSLKEAREDLSVPPWAEDLTDESVQAASQAYVAFQPYYHVTMATAAAVAPSSGAAGASAAGAGAGGGAGGGGGGAG